MLSDSPVQASRRSRICLFRPTERHQNPFGDPLRGEAAIASIRRAGLDVIVKSRRFFLFQLFIS